MSPNFNAAVEGPFQATLTGAATVGADGMPPEYGGFWFTRHISPPDSIYRNVDDSLYGVPYEGDSTAAASMFLFAEDDDTGRHIISFTHVGSSAIAPGEYEIQSAVMYMLRPCIYDNESCLAEHQGRVRSMYGRMTADSMHMYMLSGGSLVVEHADENEVSGEFTMHANKKVSISRQFMDPTPILTSDGRGPMVDTLATRLTVSGTFTAVNDPPSTID